MRILIALILLAAPAAAQDAPPFDPAPVQACLDGDADPQSCAGLAANACMEGEGGSTTVGMGYCIAAERDWWDDRLNTAYGDVMARAEASDADTDSLDAAGPRQVPALRDMQRSWIAFRDAACAFEATRFGGGTGAGPASAQCALTLTARQTLWLQDYLIEGR